MLDSLRPLLTACVLTSVVCRRPGTQTASSSQPSIQASPTDSVQTPARLLIRLTPATPIRAVRLVDSTLHDFNVVQRFVYRVAISHASSSDTLPHILTVDQPTLVGDSLVLGITYDSVAGSFSLFSYLAKTGILAVIPPPSDLSIAGSVPAFAPDGRHLAYVALPADGTWHGVVRQWPIGKVVAQTPSDTAPGTDVTIGWADWQDAIHFTFYFGLSDVRWRRVRGSLDRVGFISDTVTSSTNH